MTSRSKARALLLAVLLGIEIDTKGQTPAPPANDHFANRTILQGEDFDFAGTVYGATLEENDPYRNPSLELLQYPFSVEDSGSVWWSWTAPITGFAVLMLPEQPPLRLFGFPILNVFQGSDLQTIASRAALVAGVHVFPDFYAGFPIEAGQTYSLALVGGRLTNSNHTFHLAASASPMILKHPESQTVVAGSVAVFTVLAPGFGNDGNMQWQFNGQDIAGETNPILQLNDVKAESAGEYRVLVNVQNPSAISTSQVATLTVQSAGVQPEIRLRHGSGPTNFIVEVLGEPNGLYQLRYSPDVAFGSEAPTPARYARHSIEADLPPLSLNAVFFRAQRVNDTDRVCIENLRRIQYAKDLWRVTYRRYAGAAIPLFEVDAFLGGETPHCPSGGYYDYNAVSTFPECNVAGHVMTEPLYFFGLSSGR